MAGPCRLRYLSANVISHSILKARREEALRSAAKLLVQHATLLHTTCQSAFANQRLDGDGLAPLFSNQHDYLIFDTLTALGTQDRQHSLHSLQATRVVLFDRLHWVGSSISSSFFSLHFWTLGDKHFGTLLVPDASLSVIRWVEGKV